MSNAVDPGLRTRISRGLAWSSLNSIVLRMGSFAVGILLARLLAPEQFGVFAVALTVQTVLMTLADLGMSADLIRRPNPEKIAPTVATLALVSGGSLSVILAVNAQSIANLMGTAAAGPVIAVMSLSLVLASAGVVPFAALQRDFAQKKLFGIASAEFVFGTALTLLLLLAGWGVMALAISRIASQALTLVLQFILSGKRPTFGFDRAEAPGVLAFGIPVAGANMLSWALLNVDNVAISRLAGPVALGFYYLAFNISNWPMSALGQVVRSISIPAFSRLATGRRDLSLALVMGPVWAMSLLIGFLLAVTSAPLVELLYGEVWIPAAAILAWLGVFGALRTLFDLSASYLLARGAARSTLFVQLAWIAALIPAMIVGVSLAGTTGAAIAHVGTAVLLVCPAYVLALRLCGADVVAILRQLWPPLLAAIPAAAAALVAVALLPGPLAGFLGGGVAGTVAYALLLGPWFLRRIRALKSWRPTADPAPTESDPSIRVTTITPGGTP